MSVKLTLSFVVAVFAVGYCANILDIFDFDSVQKALEVPEKRNDQPNRNCMCKGPACVCCVDFNITLVDLGGPGCVHMKYVSPEEGFSVKVLYGKNLIHNSKIKGSTSPPICLDVFGTFAQVCAKFHDLAPTSDGLRGCLELQPKLFGEVQLEFPIGCFKSNAGSMEMEEPPAEPETSTSSEEAEKEEGEKEGDNEEEEGEEDDPDTSTVDTAAFESFILGIYKSAEKGFTLLNSLLDSPKNTTQSPPTSSTEQNLESSQRSPKSLKHPNQL